MNNIFEMDRLPDLRNQWWLGFQQRDMNLHGMFRGLKNSNRNYMKKGCGLTGCGVAVSAGSRKSSVQFEVKTSASSARITWLQHLIVLLRINADDIRAALGEDYEWNVTGTIISIRREFNEGLTTLDKSEWPELQTKLLDEAKRLEDFFLTFMKNHKREIQKGISQTAPVGMLPPDNNPEAFSEPSVQNLGGEELAQEPLEA